MWSQQGRVEGEASLSQPDKHSPCNTPQDAFGLVGHKHTTPSWLVVIVLSSRTRGSVSPSLLSSTTVPKLWWCVELCLPSCRTVHLPVFYFIKFLPSKVKR